MTTPATTSTAVWDLPIRLFHWSLALCVLAAIATGLNGGNLIEVHGQLGIVILGLLVFRLLWGIAGSSTARFSQFYPTPSRVLDYREGRWHGLGHNPVGAFSVFALLGLLCIQVGTGLCANDDITFQGPLYRLVSESTSGKLSELHEGVFNLLLVLIGLHIAAIGFYRRFKQHDLLTPMITGSTTHSVAAGHTLRKAHPLAFVVAVALAAGVAWGIGSGWVTDHFAPPPVVEPANNTAPAW